VERRIKTYGVYFESFMDTLTALTIKQEYDADKQSQNC
jgi:hypothetical protein